MTMDVCVLCEFLNYVDSFTCIYHTIGCIEILQKMIPKVVLTFVLILIKMQLFILMGYSVIIPCMYFIIQVSSHFNHQVVFKFPITFNSLQLFIIHYSWDIRFLHRVCPNQDLFFSS